MENNIINIIKLFLDNYNIRLFLEKFGNYCILEIENNKISILSKKTKDVYLKFYFGKDDEDKEFGIIIEDAKNSTPTFSKFEINNNWDINLNNFLNDYFTEKFKLDSLGKMLALINE